MNVSLRDLVVVSKNSHRSTSPAISHTIHMKAPPGMGHVTSVWRIIPGALPVKFHSRTAN